MLLRLACLGITNAFALLRLLPGGDCDKDIEILPLRHQLAVLQRQLDGQPVRFTPVDRAWLACTVPELFARAVSWRFVTVARALRPGPRSSTRAVEASDRHPGHAAVLAPSPGRLALDLSEPCGVPLLGRACDLGFHLWSRSTYSIYLNMFRNRVLTIERVQNLSVLARQVQDDAQVTGLVE
jgi:hypothetical protein